MLVCEHIFYGEIAGRLQVVREQARLPPLKLPKTYFVDADQGVIIFENLKLKHFQSAPTSAKGRYNINHSFVLNESFGEEYKNMSAKIDSLT